MKANVRLGDKHYCERNILWTRPSMVFIFAQIIILFILKLVFLKKNCWNRWSTPMLWLERSKLTWRTASADYPQSWMKSWLWMAIFKTQDKLGIRIVLNFEIKYKAWATAMKIFSYYCNSMYKIVESMEWHLNIHWSNNQLPTWMRLSRSLHFSPSNPVTLVRKYCTVLSWKPIKALDLF